MTPPFVSVIIPLYNSEKYIAETIKSALAQTWAYKEIIIVDDGSTDNSLAVAKEFEGENVKIFHQANKGASAARNKGLAEAKGDYVQFLDADDLLNPVKIESQLKILVNHPGYLCAGATIHFTDGEDPTPVKPSVDWFKDGSEDTADFLTKLYGGSLIGNEYGGMIALHAWLIPASLITKAGTWNEQLSLDDDGEFMCRIILSAKGIKYADDTIAWYRKYNTSGNISSLTRYSAHVSLLTSDKLKMQYLLERKNDKPSRTALARIFTEIAVSFYPEYPALTNEAERIAKQLAPGIKPKPFTSAHSILISNLFGWRFMKSLSKFKQKWI